MKWVLPFGAMVTLSASAALALPSCPSNSAAMTMRPDIRRGHEVRFQQRLDTIEKRLASGRYDILMFGDSITQQWPPNILAATFPGRRVLNVGVGGDGSSWLLYRLSGQKVQVRSPDGIAAVGITSWQRQTPRTAVLMIGTNDLRRGQTPCDVAAGIIAVAQRLHEIYPRAEIVVLSVLPRGPSQSDMESEIATVNAEVARLIGALEGPFRFVDVHGALNCKLKQPCDVLRPPNYVHLTEQGYELLSDALRKQVK